MLLGVNQDWHCGRQRKRENVFVAFDFDELIPKPQKQMGLKQCGSGSPLDCGHFNDSMCEKGGGSALEGWGGWHLLLLPTFFQLVSGF